MFTHNKLSTAILLACTSTSALALEPAAIDFDGIQVTPTLEVAGTHDSNYETTNDPEASWITSITPSVTVTAFGKKSQYDLNYTLNHKIFNKSGAENLTSHYLNATASYEFDARNQLGLSAALAKTEESANAFTPGELNAFNVTTLGGNYIFGAESATGNVELGLQKTSKRSANDFNKDQENDTNTLSAGFIYKATAKTKLTAEMITRDFDYVSNTSLDSRNTSYLVGARWEATAKTTGFARFGKQVKDYDASGAKNVDGNRWSLSVDWAPKSYSVVNVAANQLIDEGTYGADFTKTTNHSIAWNHDWGRGYSSTLSYTNSFKDYDNTREDKVNAYGFGLTYMAKRWMDIAINYSTTNQDSTDNTYDYDRDLVTVSVNLSL